MTGSRLWANRTGGLTLPEAGTARTGGAPRQARGPGSRGAAHGTLRGTLRPGRRLLSPPPHAPSDPFQGVDSKAPGRTLCSSPSTIRIPSPVVRLTFKGNRAAAGAPDKGAGAWGREDNMFPSASRWEGACRGRAPSGEGSQACGRLTGTCGPSCRLEGGVPGHAPRGAGQLC